MSQLRQRLTTLRQQSGAEPVAKMAPSIAERIRRVQVGQRRGADVDTHRLQAVLAQATGGEIVGPGALRITTAIPLASRHGAWGLDAVARVPSSLPSAVDISPQELLFFDTETTGLAGGSGTLAFMVGFAALAEDCLRIDQYLLTAFAGEAAMLTALCSHIERARHLVSFNGKCFDAPLMATRARLNGIALELDRLMHIDLLYPLRTGFASRWPDCRLSSAESRLLEFTRTDDLPGAEAPQAWFDYVHRGETGRLLRVLEHNRWDLVSLAALLPALDRAFAEPQRFGADVGAIARAQLRCGYTHRARQLLSVERSSMPESAALALAASLRRKGDLDGARELWERLEQQGSAAAAEHLAKYYEHVERNYTRALQLTERLPVGPLRTARARRLRRKLDPGCRGRDRVLW